MGALDAKTRRIALWIGIGALILRKRIWRAVRQRLRPWIVIRGKIQVNAPVEDVYGFWKDFSNYPRFMSYIRAVDVGNTGKLCWIAQGPAGIHVQWESQLTEFLSNQRIAWKSAAGALIRNAGHVRFRSIDGRLTEVTVELDYAPRAGLFGRAAIQLLGFDPRRRFSQDLERMRELIESRANPARTQVA